MRIIKLGIKRVDGKQTEKIGKTKGNMPGNNQVQNKQIDNLPRIELKQRAKK